MATAGALTGLTGETTEEESVPVEYGVFQNTAVTQDPNIDLQTMYGTAAVPTLTWVTQIQTGERSFDPSSQFDNSMLEDYQKLVFPLSGATLKQAGIAEGPAMGKLLKKLENWWVAHDFLPLAALQDELHAQIEKESS